MMMLLHMLLLALCPLLQAFHWPNQRMFSNRRIKTKLFHYRPFCEDAWKQLPDLEYVDLPDEVQTRQTDNVKITVQAASSPTIKYVRSALIETLDAEDDTNAIQVLNMVIFPRNNLPVWGADFVSLPANKHLLLLDAQPMNNNTEYSKHWKDWYNEQQITDRFPWGGDLPEPVQCYVSEHALWSRLTDMKTYQDDLKRAFNEHLRVYLDLLTTSDPSQSNQESYIQYRRDNDPARPMLKRLYGQEWTERVLRDHLFPSI